MLLDAVGPQRVEQRDRSDDVVAPVQRRLLGRLAHQRLGREVDRGVDLPVAEPSVERGDRQLVELGSRRTASA